MQCVLQKVGFSRVQAGVRLHGSRFRVWGFRVFVSGLWIRKVSDLKFRVSVMVHCSSVLTSPFAPLRCSGFKELTFSSMHFFVTGVGFQISPKIPINRNFEYFRKLGVDPEHGSAV